MGVPIKLNQIPEFRSQHTHTYSKMKQMKQLTPKVIFKCKKSWSKWEFSINVLILIEHKYATFDYV